MRPTAEIVARAAIKQLNKNKSTMKDVFFNHGSSKHSFYQFAVLLCFNTNASIALVLLLYCIIALLIYIHRILCAFPWAE
jgi:hypothetical protein